MSSKTLIAVLLCLASTVLSGCDIGYSRMLFVTKTTAAIEVDTAPPTIQIGIGRLEGEFGPQFEDRKKIPTLASFRFQNDGFFAPFLGSAFTVGDAALAMAALYDDETPSTGSNKPKWEQRLELIKEFNSSLILSAEPKRKKNGKLEDAGFMKSGEVRPIFFGTDTSLGLKVAWSGLTAQIPDTVRFGYVRKELAWVPITYKKVSDTEHVVGAASLLATVDSGVTLDNSPGVNLMYLQYFATGDAATLLALQHVVRKAMFIRLDPNQQKLLGAYTASFGNSELSLRIENWIDATADQDPNPRRAIVNEFLTRERIGVRSATWLNTSSAFGRTGQYIKFIEEQDIQ